MTTFQATSTSHDAVASEGILAIRRDAGGVFERINEQLRKLNRLLAEGFTDDAPVNSKSLQESLDDLQGSVEEAEIRHRETIVYAEALSESQATALNRSREIVRELEQTRCALADARRFAEHQKEQRLHLLSRVFENAREGVVILDTEGMIREVNPVFEEMAGRKQIQLRTKHLDEVLRWDFAEYRRVLRSAYSGQSWTGKIRIWISDEEPRSYLLSFSPVQGEETFSNVIVLLSDVTDLERTQHSLEKQALHDQLTGLPNRRFYRDRIQQLIERCEHSQGSFAVCFIDLDDFKHVNDTMGHLVGDELLVQVAERIRQNSGADAFVARFGGDEFAILIPETDCDQLRTAIVTDRVLQALREPFQVSGTDLTIGASIGVTEYPTQTRDIDELMQFADLAMYAAKKAGRNQIRVFARELQSGIEQRNRILRDLNRALADNEISLLYQPQVDLLTGQCTGCEALARWKTPDGRNVAPSEFVPIAEQSGLVVPLGEAVLSMVCDQLVDWEMQGCRPERVAINLSPRQLYGRNFIERLREILDMAGARPEWISLEITENAVMGDIPRAMRIMDELSEMGIQIALDDFGTGHSSLSYLKQFNVHSLKVDRSFIKDLPGDERVTSIIESVIHLARGRELKVVAEGIETREQYRILREMLCDRGQGYYIARPLQADDFSSFICGSHAYQLER